jgi:hypothetical protein
MTATEPPPVTAAAAAAQVEAAITRAREHGLTLTAARAAEAIAAARAALAAGHLPVHAVNAAAAVLYPVAQRRGPETGRLMVATLNVLIAVSDAEPAAFQILALYGEL